MQYCDARKEEGQKSTRDARRKEGKKDDNFCLTLQHQEGGAVSNAVAELARAKPSNNNYYYCYYCTCTHIHTMHAVAMLLAMCRCSVCMLASHLAATVKF